MTLIDNPNIVQYYNNKEAEKQIPYQPYSTTRQVNQLLYKNKTTPTMDEEWMVIV